MNVEQSFPVETAWLVNSNKVSDWLRKRIWFVIFVIFPIILAAFYYLLMASDIYVTESRFVVKSPDQKRPQLTSLANLIQTTGLSGGQEQANEIFEFVRSRDAV